MFTPEKKAARFAEASAKFQTQDLSGEDAEAYIFCHPDGDTRVRKSRCSPRRLDRVDIAKIALVTP